MRVLESKKAFASLDYLFGRVTHPNDGNMVKELKEKLTKAETELQNCKKISSLQERLLEKNN